MDTIKDNHVLKCYARRRQWNLINQRHQHETEITKWRSSVDRHLNAIESKLRDELKTLHEATVDIITQSLTKHGNGEITTTDFEKEMHQHVAKYFGRSLVRTSNSIDQAEVVEGDCKSRDMDSGPNRVDINEEKAFSLDIENMEENASGRDIVKELCGDTSKFNIHEKTVYSPTAGKETAKQRGTDGGNEGVEVNTGVSEDKNREHTKDRDNCDDNGSTETSTSPTFQIDSYEKKDTLLAAVRAMESFNYTLKIDVSFEDLANFIPSLGSCAMSCIQPLVSDISVKDMYFDIAAVYPLLQYTSVIRPPDEKKVQGHDKLLLGGVAIDGLGRILLADKSRHKLVVCAFDGTILTEVDFASKPHGLAVMSDKVMAVSVGESRQKSPCIEIISLNTFEKLREIEVRTQYRSIYYRNARFIGACEHAVHILNQDGKIEHSISKPYMACIRYACADETNRVYFTDWNKNSLHCVMDDETEVFTYRHPNLIGTTSVDVDASGYCYVTGYISNNIHLLTSDGSLIKILLSQNDGLHEPRVISFRPFSREFVVVDNSGECDFKLYEITDQEQGDDNIDDDDVHQIDNKSRKEKA